MNQENKSKSTGATVLGIIALIVAIASLLISFIPIVGLISLILGSIAILLSIIAFFFAHNRDSKLIILAAFIVSIFSLIFSFPLFWQMIFLKDNYFGNGFTYLGEKFGFNLIIFEKIKIALWNFLRNFWSFF